MDLQILSIGIGVITAYIGWLEKRFYDMKTEFNGKLEEKEKFNALVHKELKEDITRMEGKIDMLILLKLKETKDDK